MNTIHPNSYVRAATYVSVVTAVLLVLLKLYAWVVSDSVSILSTLVDSFLDLLASAINLIAVRHALSPADKEHRFGHGKAEPLAALGQSGFIIGSGMFVLIEAISHLSNPQLVTHGAVGVTVIIISIFMTLGLVAFQKFVISKTHSEVIEADSLHYQGDILINLSVLVSLGITIYWQQSYTDSLIGAGIAVFLIYGATKILKKSLDSLMDRELPDEERQKVLKIALTNPKVRGAHDLRTRRAGRTTFIQLHLEIDGHIPLSHAHAVSDEVKARIEAEFDEAEVFIHEDPAGIKEPRDKF